MLWDEVQGLDVRSFRKIADDLIAESRGLPTVKEIMLRLTKMRERGRDRDKQRESTYRVEAIPKTPMPPEVKEKLERLRMRSVPKEE